MEEINRDTLLEKMIYSINDFKDEMVKSFNYIREDISCMRGDIKELRQDVNDLKSDVATLKSDVATLKSDVTTLKSDVTTLKSDVTTLKSDVTSLNGELQEFKKENKKNWAKYEADRKRDKEELFNILHNYDISISNQLGDPNVEKMKKLI